MPDLDTIYNIGGVVGFSALYLWLLWTATRDWSVRIALALFVFLPAHLQTLVLGCILLWAIKDAKAARDIQEERMKHVPLGPRPV